MDRRFHGAEDVVEAVAPVLLEDRDVCEHTVVQCGLEHGKPRLAGPTGQEVRVPNGTKHILAARGEVEDVNLYYLLSTAIAGDTVLRYELMDRIRPWSLF
ncbi:MAG: hypothetical protein ACOVRP_03115, partial [Gemmatimonas sp.]